VDVGKVARHALRLRDFESEAIFWNVVEQVEIEAAVDPPGIEELVYERDGIDHLDSKILSCAWGRFVKP
jgi:hypothetical protein